MDKKDNNINDFTLLDETEFILNEDDFIIDTDNIDMDFDMDMDLGPIEFTEEDEKRFEEAKQALEQINLIESNEEIFEEMEQNLNRLDFKEYFNDAT